MRNSRYNSGLGWSLKGMIKSVVAIAATAVVSSLTGGWGAFAGPYVASFVDNNLWPDESMNPWCSRTVAPGPATTEKQNQAILDWMEKYFNPWFAHMNSNIGDVYNKQYALSAEFRNEINKILTALHVAKLYYAEVNQASQTSRMAFTPEENVEWQSKEQVCMIFIASVMEGYKDVLKHHGATASVKEVNQTGSKYTGHTPEKFNWSGSTSYTTMELFVAPGTGNVPSDIKVPKGNVKPTESQVPIVLPTVPVNTNNPSKENLPKTQEGGVQNEKVIGTVVKTLATVGVITLAVKALKPAPKK